jgi:hypothetical protein
MTSASEPGYLIYSRNWGWLANASYPGQWVKSHRLAFRFASVEEAREARKGWAENLDIFMIPEEIAP